MNRNPHGYHHQGSTPPGPGQPYPQQPANIDPRQNQYGLPPGGTAHKANIPALITFIVLAVIVVMIYVGAFVFSIVAQSEGDTSPGSSESSSESTQGLAPNSDDSPQFPSAQLRTNAADDSLPDYFRKNLPVNLDGWLAECEESGFTLEQPGDDEESGDYLCGVNCTGAADSAWALESIDVLDDANYTNSVVSDAKDSAHHSIVSDTPDNFAAMVGNESGMQTLIIANPSQAVSLRIEYVQGGEDQMTQIFDQLGYS